MNRRSSSSSGYFWLWFLLLLLGVIAIVGLILGAIALSKANNLYNTQVTQEEIFSPSGKMALPANETHHKRVEVIRALELTGFELIFGRDVTIDASPGTYLIPTGGYNGTYHFDMQVIAEAVIPHLVKKNTPKLDLEKNKKKTDIEKHEEKGERINGKRVEYDGYARNLRAYLTVNGHIYHNAGWAEDESINFFFPFERPNKYASMTLSGLVYLESGQEVGILLTAPRSCAWCTGNETVHIYDARLDIAFQQSSSNNGQTLYPYTFTTLFLLFISILNLDFRSKIL